MARNAKDVNQEAVRNLLIYDPGTGEFRWRVNHGRMRAGDIAGCSGRFGSVTYWQIGFFGRMYLAHRLAYFYMEGKWPEADIDHVDGDGLNNKWANLRCATRSQNFMNRRPNVGASGYKGVYINNGRFSARITKDYETIYLGTFGTAKEAHAAYNEAAKNMFGEFARPD